MRIQLPADSDVLAFLTELAPLCGTIQKALLTYVHCTPLFRDWQRKVSQCPHCRRWVPAWWDRVPPTIDEHRIRNPHGEPRPHYITCPGSGAPATYQAVDKAALELLEVHLVHRIQTVQPGLL